MRGGGVANTFGYDLSAMQPGGTSHTTFACRVDSGHKLSVYLDSARVIARERESEKWWEF